MPRTSSIVSLTDRPRLLLLGVFEQNDIDRGRTERTFAVLTRSAHQGDRQMNAMLFGLVDQVDLFCPADRNAAPFCLGGLKAGLGTMVAAHGCFALRRQNSLHDPRVAAGCTARRSLLLIAIHPSDRSINGRDGGGNGGSDLGFVQAYVASGFDRRPATAQNPHLPKSSRRVTALTCER